MKQNWEGIQAQMLQEIFANPELTDQQKLAYLRGLDNFAKSWVKAEKERLKKLN